MIAREQTVQQSDPVGALAARSLTLLGCLGMVVYAIVMTVVNSADIDNVGVAIVGIGMIVGAATLIAVAANPLRAPLNRGVHIAAMGLGVFGLAFNAASMWQGNAFIRDDWGPPMLGFISLLMVPYRPPREIAILGALAAVFAGFVAALEVGILSTDLPVMIYVIIAATPVLAMSFGGAVFARAVLRMVHRWHSRASSAVSALANERKAGLARSVQQDRVTILNRDVVPFFAAVLERGGLLGSDRTRASEISESIRRLMVAEVDRSWLDLVVEQAAGATRGPATEAVHDPERLAVAMSTDQRTAVRAAIVAIFGHPAFEPRGFDVRISRTSAGYATTIRADFAAGEGGIRADLAPYLAVLRVVFSHLHADFGPPTLTVRFSYDKH
ncbi:MAG: hypothetical protein JWP85_2344 [Rhodoglobus sp.]|nr:hypothetical protein [Rhodoglobus sp.]